MNIENFKNVNEAFKVTGVDEDSIDIDNGDAIVMDDIKSVLSVAGVKEFHGHERPNKYGVTIDIHRDAPFHYQFYNYVFWFETEIEQQRCLNWLRLNIHNGIGRARCTSDELDMLGRLANQEESESDKEAILKMLDDGRIEFPSKINKEMH